MVERKTRGWRAGSLVLGIVAAAVCAQAAEDTAESYICVEAETGMVLAESNADIVRPPASVVKLILMLMVSEGLDAGTWTEDTPITASALAASMGGTQVFLKEGEVHRLDDIMHAIAIASANDAAMALAESLWGSKDDCLKAMNERAAALGMANTKYYSVHGLPPDNGKDFDQTTARDIATLARECVKSPHILRWVGQKEFVFRPGEPAKANTNKLLWRMEDCDGLKTGYIRAAKFCIAATAERGGLRLISVVLGHPSKYGRFNLAEELLESGFEQICKVKAASKGETVVAKTKVRDAAMSVDTIEAVISDDLYVIVNKGDVELLEIVPEVAPEIAAPIHRGDELGSLVVQLSGVPLAQTSLVSSVDVEAATMSKLWRNGVDQDSGSEESWSTRAWNGIRSIFAD